MSESEYHEDKSPEIINYKFHHIDISKCRKCKDFWCEDACFRGIYKVINKESKPECIVIEDLEDKCIKCHICTTSCKYEAISID
ncbi:MAG: 4Fe-4S binding protein [Promethearchaeia archaeon]